MDTESSSHQEEEDPATSWRNLKLSLERPYKDDHDERIKTLFDIEPDGQFIYEIRETPAARLQHHLHRIFKERGSDFFDHMDGFSDQLRDVKKDEGLVETDQKSTDSAVSEVMSKPMTLGELHTMRLEIMPHLHVALGEMTQAKDILASLLSSVKGLHDTFNPSQENPVPTLSATMVTRLPPIISIQTFNSQIIVGSKDEALRKAANLFKSESLSMERSRIKNEQYWVNALRIRRSNWRLVPAPLPPGSSMGKGADRTAKDFLVSYGLEESPAGMRRRAIAHLADVGVSNDLVFSFRHHTRLKVSLTTAVAGSPRSTSNNFSGTSNASLDDELNSAQAEIIEHEIFSFLVKEASNLPTALARVSERLIVIDAAQSIELRFELINDEGLLPTSTDRASSICDIVYHGLRLLLLRRHMHAKTERLVSTSVFTQTGPSGYSPQILQPIIDFLQYKVFCERIKMELFKTAGALNICGISTTVFFNSVGETGQELVGMLLEPRSRPVSGEAIVIIDNRHTLRLTFISPSNLTVHLSQATLYVFSLPQLSQLLMDETERFLLQRICNLGLELSGGTWFIDLNYCVARWEGCVLTFCITFEDDFGITCSAFRLDEQTGKRGHLQAYSPKCKGNESLLKWVQNVIKSVN